MRPRIHMLTAAFGILASSGALADKGSNGGPPPGVGFGNGRGGSRFVDAVGAGPASAFEQRTQLVKGGGLEFKAGGSPQAAPGHDDAGSGPRSSENGVPSAKPNENAVIPRQGAAANANEKTAVADAEVTTAFAPWKVTDRDGKPAGKKAGLECAAK
jgi:hypothetical protein